MILWQLLALAFWMSSRKGQHLETDLLFVSACLDSATNGGKVAVARGPFLSRSSDEKIMVPATV
jgi:hypothetical protein